MIKTNDIASLKAVGAIEHDVAFPRQLKGYDTAVVDRYIKRLTDAYQTAYREYTTVCRKYADLLDKHTQLESKAKLQDLNAGAISKTLLDAEITARNIVANARAEAEKIRREASLDRAVAERSVEAANESVLETISRLQGLVTA